VAGKAIKILAAQRQYGGVGNGQFAVLMGGQNQRSHCQGDARTHMGVVGEGVQGFWSGARGGGEKVSIVVVLIGSMG
jgi:hypothetical protein